MSEDLEQLREWARAAEAEISRFEAQIAQLQQELAAARERSDLLRRLIDLRQKPKLVNRSNDQRPEPEHDVANSHWRPPLGNDLETCVAEILAENRSPMHISQIRTALLERGVAIPGKGEEANVIVRLSRDKDHFVRTGRGTYGLAEWGLAEVVPTKAKRTKSRSRRRRDTS